MKHVVRVAVGFFACACAGSATAGDWLASSAGPSPLFGNGYVHLGASAAKQADEGTLTLGGFPVPGADYETNITGTASIEAGVFLRDGFAISAFGTLPMTTPNIGAGSLAGIGNIGDETIGFYSITAHAHVPVTDMASLYAGAGVGYMHVFGTADGVVTNLAIASAMGAVLQAGVDLRLNEHFGVFADVKKFIIGTEATGTFGGFPLVAQTRVDPWVVSAGGSFSF